MTMPTTSFRLDHGSLEDEFARVLEVIQAENVQTSPPPDRELSPDLMMVQAFVEYDVNSSSLKSERLVRRLVKEDERKEKNRQVAMEQDARKATLEQIFEVFEGCFSQADIKKLLNKYEYNPDRVIEELGNASVINSRSGESVQPAKVVYASTKPIVFNNPPRNSPIKSNSSPDLTQVVTEEDAVRIADDYARRLNAVSTHHYSLAHRYGKNDIRYGPLTAIARDERKKAYDAQEKADNIRAAEISDSLDLHTMPVERALRFTNSVIQSVRKRRPGQAKLEVITGRGMNNAKGKAVLKAAMIQWLNQMKIKYELNSKNPGVVIVNLRSI